MKSLKKECLFKRGGYLVKRWKVDYKGHDIRVENSWADGESLYVNDVLQDQQLGFAVRSRLYGKVTFADGRIEMIKVSLGGWLTISCRVFIDDKLVLSNKMNRIKI